MRRAAKVSLGPTHVTVNLRKIARVESVHAISDHVTGFSTPQTTSLLSVSAGTTRVRTVAALVPWGETVETQAMWTVARDVRFVSAQMTRFLLRRKLALGLAMPTLTAAEATQRRSFVIIVKVPRLP